MYKIKLSVFWAALGVFSGAWAADSTQAQPGSVPARVSQAGKEISSGEENPPPAARPKIKSGFHPFKTRSVREEKIREKGVRGRKNRPLPADTPARWIAPPKGGNRLYITGNPSRNDIQNKIRREIRYCGKSRTPFCAIDPRRAYMTPAFATERNFEEFTFSAELKKEIEFNEDSNRYILNKQGYLLDLEEELKELHEKILKIPLEYAEEREEKQKEIKAQEELIDIEKIKKEEEEIALKRDKRELSKIFRGAKLNRIKRLTIETDMNSTCLTTALLEEFFSGYSECQSLTLDPGRHLLEENAFPNSFPRPAEKLFPHEKLTEMRLLTQVNLDSFKLMVKYAPHLQRLHLCGRILPSHLECLATSFPHLKTLCLQENAWTPFLGLSLYNLSPCSNAGIGILSALARYIGEVDRLAYKNNLIAACRHDMVHALGPHEHSYWSCFQQQPPVSFTTGKSLAGVHGSIKTLLCRYRHLSMSLKALDPNYEGLTAHLESAWRIAEGLLRSGVSLSDQEEVQDHAELQEILQGLLQEACEPQKLFPEESFQRTSSYFPNLKHLKIVSGLNVILPLQKALWVSRLESIHFAQYNLGSLQSEGSFTEGLSKCNFSSLKELQFSHAKLEGLIFELPLNAPCLKVFRARGCLGLEGANLPQLLEKMPDLTDFHFTHCFRDPRRLAEGRKELIVLPSHRSLRALSLDQNCIDDDDLREILHTQKSRERLEVLNLAGNEVTSGGLREFAKRYFPVLQELNFEGNIKIGVEGLEALMAEKHNFPRLESLCLFQTARNLSDQAKEVYRRRLQKAFPNVDVGF